MFSDILASIATEAHTQPALTTIFLGANDAAWDATGKNNVPLTEYKQNLRAFVQHYKTMYPRGKLLLITPPPPVYQGEYEGLERVGVAPVFEEGKMRALPVSGGGGWGEDLKGENWRGMFRDKPRMELLYLRPWDRKQEITRLYRDAVIEIGEENTLDSRIGVMDTWEMMFGATWNGTVFYDRDTADQYYYDGLHFNADGDFYMYLEVVRCVRRLWPLLGF
ncbi:hypothetical protein BCR33DRAFT_404580 [Rhizoclosmatium globosum]|uniref:SGNH hydrolase-type esterase domain-containing protein n=1 Tax=Rhizoclosmatium globosum TaxID=329046 RepID=A0A1Y2CY71_9FUNG|nr:hypothetical protein BCR33DRAFT_404580 [Rhizoclosmatium globosum]|eukprot:ORY51982.1 hypothetical protein BCR33DRAFT_404580 [Rhizoclosmatium globosum]